MAIKRFCLALVLLVNSVYAFGAEFLYCPQHCMPRQPGQYQ